MNELFFKVQEMNYYQLLDLRNSLIEEGKSISEEMERQIERETELYFLNKEMFDSVEV